MNKKHKLLIFLGMSLILYSGCTSRESSPDILVDNQQIVVNVDPNAIRPDCDTLVITCIDYRFAVANQDFINNTLKLKDNYDYISIPGSILNLVNPETQELVFSKFALSVKLHLIEHVVIISHKDCGGYGGSASFGSDLSERETLITDLKKAKAFLIEKYPTLGVDLYLEYLSKEGEKESVHFEKIR